jgi:hypothetical protein
MLAHLLLEGCCMTNTGMTNTELLRYTGLSQRVLLEIERQTQFCLRIALTSAECPACHAAVNQVQASGVPDLDSFDATGKTHYDYHCPQCKRGLVDIVPAFRLGAHPYSWRLKEPVATTG